MVMVKMVMTYEIAVHLLRRLLCNVSPVPICAEPADDTMIFKKSFREGAKSVYQAKCLRKLRTVNMVLLV